MNSSDAPGNIQLPISFGTEIAARDQYSFSRILFWNALRTSFISSGYFADDPFSTIYANQTGQRVRGMIGASAKNIDHPNGGKKETSVCGLD